MTNILLYAFFVNNVTNIGETGLSPTIDIYRITKADLTSSLVVDSQAATNVGGGFYSYLMADGDLVTYDYIGKFKTTSSDVISKEIAEIRWSDISPTIAISATAAAAVSTGSIAITACATLSQLITSTSAEDIGTATKVWFAAKADRDDGDNESIFFMEKTGGLTVVNGAAHGTTADGSISVSGSAGAWVFPLALQESITALLAKADHPGELKALLASGDIIIIWTGSVSISTGLIKALS